MASNEQKIIDDLRNDAKTHQGKKITSQQIHFYFYFQRCVNKNQFGLPHMAQKKVCTIEIGEV